MSVIGQVFEFDEPADALTATAVASVLEGLLERLPPDAWNDAGLHVRLQSILELAEPRLYAQAVALTARNGNEQ